MEGHGLQCPRKPAELVISKWKFEGRIGIVSDRRWGRVFGLQEQHVQGFGQVVRKQLTDT